MPGIPTPPERIQRDVIEFRTAVRSARARAEILRHSSEEHIRKSKHRVEYSKQLLENQQRRPR